jgi:hypothetical protein
MSASLRIELKLNAGCSVVHTVLLILCCICYIIHTGATFAVQMSVA